LFFIEWRYGSRDEQGGRSCFWDRGFGVRSGSYEECQTDIESCELSVHFLNVGDADSTLLVLRKENESHFALIDAADIGSEVVRYLDAQRPEVLDYVFLTHPHRDHLGQMHSILDKFDVHLFITNKYATDFESYGETSKKMYRIIQKKRIKIDFTAAGSSYNMSGVRFLILGPIQKYDDLNNNSLVIMVVFGKKRFIFMADAQKKSETDIIGSNQDLKADVIKVGHHGSATSTQWKFLKVVNPIYAVVSAGPSLHGVSRVSEAVLKKLQDVEAKVFKTFECGNIVFRCKNDEIFVDTEKTPQKIAA
jgi:competence protein ComEC